MKIEIVTHCYANQIPFYAQALVCQLSSLILYPPSCDVQLTVCCTVTDTHVMDVLKYFADIKPPFILRLYTMPVEELGRRSIGRNVAAKKTAADIIWFTDADFVFRGCLQNLASFNWPNAIDMVFPESSPTSSKAYGNNLSNDLGILDIDPDQFTLRKHARAYGGIQIVNGDFAREHGYLDNHPEWRQSVDIPTPQYKEDVRFRRHRRILKIDLPNVYRIQHSEKGRNLLKYEN